MDHLRHLRALQDESCLARRSDAKAGGFGGFVPLPYQPENNDIPVQTPPTGFDALRTLAVSRIRRRRRPALRALDLAPSRFHFVTARQARTVAAGRFGAVAP